MYINELGNIVNKCNNTYHKTINIKPVDEEKAHIFTLVKKLIIKVPKSKFLWLKKLKTLCRDLKGEETVVTFYEKSIAKTNQKRWKRKGDKLYLKWKN